MSSQPTTESAQPPETAQVWASPVERQKCDHCGHVRGLHGRNHGCISAFADGESGKSCMCPGFVTPSGRST